MLKRFWRWLWPEASDDMPSPKPHTWTAWTVIGQKDGPFGTRYDYQRRRCLTCGLTMEAPVSQVAFVECDLQAGEAK